MEWVCVCVCVCVCVTIVLPPFHYHLSSNSFFSYSQFPLCLAPLEFIKHFLTFWDWFKYPPIYYSLLPLQIKEQSRAVVGGGQQLFRSLSWPISPGSGNFQSVMVRWRYISVVPGSLQFPSVHFQASLPFCMLFLLPGMPSSHSLIHLSDLFMLSGLFQVSFPPRSLS